MTTQRRMVLVGAMFAVLVASMLVVRLSSAAFTATTSNAANSWATGSVTLTDDDSDSAMFSVSGMVPGQSEERCIAVNYAGNVAATVRLFAQEVAQTEALATDLLVSVQIGTGGSFGNCTGFTSESTLLSDEPLADFATNHGAWATGLPSTGAWTPTSSESRTYRFVVQLDPDSDKQGATAQYAFVWEAQTS